MTGMFIPVGEMAPERLRAGVAQAADRSPHLQKKGLKAAVRKALNVVRKAAIATRRRLMILTLRNPYLAQRRGAVPGSQSKRIPGRSDARRYPGRRSE